MTGDSPALSSVDVALTSIASHRLPGSPPIRLHGVDPTALVERVVAERLTGLLIDAVDAGDADLPAPAIAELTARHHGALLWCLHLERRLLEVEEWFDAEGPIEHLVIKGSALAHLDSLRASHRTFADVDLLVRQEHFDRAIQILRARGAARPWAERRPGFDRRFAKSVTMHFDDGIEVDVHRSLCDGVHGFRTPVASLFDANTVFDLGGRRVRALDPIPRLLHSAYHAVLGSQTPSLFNLRDIALAMTAGEVEVDAVTTVVGRWRGEAVLAIAVEAVFERLDFEAPAWAAWLDSVNVSATERALVGRQRVDGSSFGRARIDALKELLGVRDRAAYLAAWAWPTTEHLRSRGMRRRDLLRPSELGRLVRVVDLRGWHRRGQ